jgi:hypothetical protein
MHVIVKNGQRNAVKIDCKEVVITITSYRLKSKRANRLKIKAKGKSPKVNQARL